MNLFRKIILPFIILFCASITAIYAQAQKLSFTTFNNANGLSQNTINVSFKDHYGFMWFGTQDGLNKYDGYKVTVYKHRSNDKKTLPTNFITSICEDKHGDLWIGTRIGGLSKYNRSKDDFTNFVHNPAISSSISDNNIKFIYKDRRSSIWIGTGNGLNVLVPETGEFKRFFYKHGDLNSLSNRTVLSIYEDADDNLWVGTAYGLNLLNRKSGLFKQFIDKEVNPFADNTINVIIQDGKHQLWMGTNKGLKLFDIKNNTFRYFAADPDVHSADGINPVFCMAKSDANKLWMGTNTTLQLFDTDKKQLIPISDGTQEDGLMPNDGIYSILKDEDQILWIGTTSQGILKYDQNLPLFSSFKASLTSVPSAKNIIRGISEDKKGNLYLATDVGLSYFNRLGNSYKTYQHDKSNQKSISSDYTTSVLVSKKNNSVWIGTYSSGLDSFNPETGAFKHYTSGKGPYQLSSNAIAVLLEDRRGNLLVGTEFGLNVFDPSSQTFTRYVHDQKNSNSIGDNSVQALFEDKKGNIWIGGYTHGITIFNPINKSFSRLDGKNSTLSSNVISAFYEDKMGDMWIGTMEGGLNFYSQRTKKITTFQEHNGLINNTINYITQDKYGYIWLSTNQGVVRFDVIGKAFRNFDSYNGLKSLEFNLGAGARLKNGEIVLGSINGFHMINSEKLPFNDHKPPVVLTGFSLFNKPVAVGTKYSPLKQTILTTKEITLNYNQSVFTIEFAALDYTVPSMNRYAYKLEGFDEEWQLVNHQKEATYTNLNPGKYVFRVKGSNNDGVWSDQETKLILHIAPPYWMTWWFRTLLVIFVLAIVFLIYKYRVGFLNRQKLQLQRLVQERTREIGIQTQELHRLNHDLQTQSEELQVQSEELQSQSNELWSKTQDLELLNEALGKQKEEEHRARQEAEDANKAKSTFLATMSHEIRTPMNGVLGMASLLSETKLDAEQREYTEAILTSGDSLLNVINDILDFSKIESGHMDLDLHDFELRKCIENVLDLFESKRSKLGINLIYHIDESIPKFIYTDSFRLRQILTNIVGNAIKFTSRGEVGIRVSCDNVGEDAINLLFTVRDTGIGIPPEKIDNLFNAFNQVDSSITRKYGGSGLGLVICERLLKLFGGEITVESEFGTGSVFSFNIICGHTKCIENDSSIGINFEKKVRENEGAKKEVNLLSERLAIAFPFTMLVAEDNLMNQKLMIRILNKLGYQPDLANDGLEVLELMKTTKYDIILMDIQMPNLDGLETTRVIRQSYGEKPLILAMTANALTEDKISCYQAGMDGYLSKPVNLELLITTLKNMYSNL